MKRTYTIAISLAGTLFATQALAHDPKAVEGGLDAWIVHQVTQTDHIVALVAVVVFGVGLYALQKMRSKSPMD